MSRLCVLTESVTQEPIYVNPAQVCWIRRDEEFTEIIFVNDTRAFVTETIDVVRNALDGSVSV